MQPLLSTKLFSRKNLLNPFKLNRFQSSLLFHVNTQTLSLKEEVALFHKKFRFMCANGLHTNKNKQRLLIVAYCILIILFHFIHFIRPI